VTARAARATKEVAITLVTRIEILPGRFAFVLKLKAEERVTESAIARGLIPSADSGPLFRLRHPGWGASATGGIEGVGSQDRQPIRPSDRPRPDTEQTDPVPTVARRARCPLAGPVGSGPGPDSSPDE
jgi:hypothetical protein